jgi:predicted NodU family carbamoyl transferase
MTTLGISGLFAVEGDDYPPGAFSAFYHDAAACLVSGGETLAAAEEERFNREKHTNRFPANAIRACLKEAGTRPEELSSIAYFFEELYTDTELATADADEPLLNAGSVPIRQQIMARVSQALDYDVTKIPVKFASHHDAHAASAYFDSSFQQSLVVVADGNGERSGLTVYTAAFDTGLRELRTYGRKHSLGHFYTAVTKILGYRDFDEYKVMGLASFGRAENWRKTLSSLWDVDDAGNYHLSHGDVLKACHGAGLRPRRSGDILLDAHKDLAAAAQEILETILIKVIRFWLRETGLRYLCLAGGVAQNTTLNGKLLQFRELDAVYVPPAAHDGGAALGAAMLADPPTATRRPRSGGASSQGRRFSASPYLGGSLGSEDEILRQLGRWGAAVSVRKMDDIASFVADALAKNEVVGWAQGRAEFGPRALGNRSILADPRPRENRDRVNRIIKQREDYRPFAPVVPRCDAEKYFELPPVTADYSFMSFVVSVRPEMRSHLGAVTHVDGTARLQTVAECQNPLFFRVLREFGTRTGTSVLLNTSFNNYAEPIVQSVHDAVACLITTRLSLLAIGAFEVRVADEAHALGGLRFELPPFCELVRTVSRWSTVWTLVRRSAPAAGAIVSSELAHWLLSGKALVPAGEACPAELRPELRSMWDRRLLRPVPI